MRNTHSGSSCQRSVVIRRHRPSSLDEPVNAERPSVGTPVRAGTTPLGRVRDFSPVARQEISELTSDSGNHLHMELVRTEADLIP